MVTHKIQKKAAAQNYMIGLPYLEAHRFANACAHCMSKEETRYYLRGVCLQYDGKTLMAIATDGHRLAHCRVNVEAANLKADKNLNCILPDAAVLWLMKIKKSDDFVILTIDQAALTVCIKYGTIEATFSLIDGTYPDWKVLWDKAAKACRKAPEAFYNVKYINDIANAVKGMGKDRTRIGFVYARENPQESPLIVETPDTGIHYLLMPMK